MFQTFFFDAVPNKPNSFGWAEPDEFVKQKGQHDAMRQSYMLQDEMARLEHVKDAKELLDYTKTCSADTNCNPDIKLIEDGLHKLTDDLEKNFHKLASVLDQTDKARQKVGPQDIEKKETSSLRSGSTEDTT